MMQSGRDHLKASFVSQSPKWVNYLVVCLFKAGRAVNKHLATLLLLRLDPANDHPP
jgi:hypothetical protein